MEKLQIYMHHLERERWIKLLNLLHKLVLRLLAVGFESGGFVDGGHGGGMKYE